MKKSFALAVISGVLFFCLLLGGCNNSVDDMLEDYNGQFTWTYVTISGTQDEEEEEVLSPGDEGFNPEDMLRDEYFLQYDSTLNLAGPPNNVYSYTWSMYDPEDNFSEISVNTMNGTLNARSFIIYVPDSGLETNHTYQLKLKIRTRGGVTYQDNCSVVIYPHYTY